MRPCEFAGLSMPATRFRVGGLPPLDAYHVSSPLPFPVAVGVRVPQRDHRPRHRCTDARAVRTTLFPRPPHCRAKSEHCSLPSGPVDFILAPYPAHPHAWVMDSRSFEGFTANGLVQLLSAASRLNADGFRLAANHALW